MCAGQIRPPCPDQTVVVLLRVGMGSGIKQKDAGACIYVGEDLCSSIYSYVGLQVQLGTSFVKTGRYQPFWIFSYIIYFSTVEKKM